jgi:hypothetical protein
MNQILKYRAWKVVEVALPVASCLFIILHWKSVLAWLLDSAMILAEAVIPVLLLAFLLFVLERND